jgi:hypothetical protein
LFAQFFGKTQLAVLLVVEHLGVLFAEIEDLIIQRIRRENPDRIGAINFAEIATVLVFA